MSNDELLRLVDHWWQVARHNIYAVEDDTELQRCLPDAYAIVEECNRLRLPVDPAALVEFSEMIEARTDLSVRCRCGQTGGHGPCPRCGELMRHPFWGELHDLEKSLLRAKIAVGRIVYLATSTKSSPTEAVTHNADPRPRLLLADGQAILDGRAIALTEKQYLLVELLLETPGDPIPVTKHDFRSRDLDGLPKPLQELIERRPGKGTRIPLDRLYLSPEMGE